jgi:hypothetical protein
MEACHGPGGRLNNRLWNLCWNTHHANNGPDKLRDGTLARGEQLSKLTKTEVQEIRRLYNSERNMPRGCGHAPSRRIWTQHALAKKYGISQISVSRILTGKAWCWLTQMKETSQ